MQNIIDAEKDEGNVLSADDLFKDAIFRNIVVSLLATVGLYFIASILFVRIVGFREAFEADSVLCTAV